MKRNAMLIGTLAAGLVLAAGCGRKGPGERAGEKLDDAGRKMGDAVDKDGPMENAGEAVDKAARDVKKGAGKHD